MKCPKCNSRTLVYDSRWWETSKQHVRSHRCTKCGFCFRTAETFVKEMEGSKYGHTRMD